jgi:hypothetical protein
LVKVRRFPGDVSKIISVLIFRVVTWLEEEEESLYR